MPCHKSTVVCAAAMLMWICCSSGSLRVNIVASVTLPIQTLDADQPARWKMYITTAG